MTCFLSWHESFLSFHGNSSGSFSEGNKVNKMNKNKEGKKKKKRRNKGRDEVWERKEERKKKRQDTFRQVSKILPKVEIILFSHLAS